MLFFYVMPFSFIKLGFYTSTSAKRRLNGCMRHLNVRFESFWLHDFNELSSLSAWKFRKFMTNNYTRISFRRNRNGNQPARMTTTTTTGFSINNIWLRRQFYVTPTPHHTIIHFSDFIWKFVISLQENAIYGRVDELISFIRNYCDALTHSTQVAGETK